MHPESVTLVVFLAIILLTVIGLTASYVPSIRSYFSTQESAPERVVREALVENAPAPTAFEERLRESAMRRYVALMGDEHLDISKSDLYLRISSAPVDTDGDGVICASFDAEVPMRGVLTACADVETPYGQAVRVTGLLGIAPGVLRYEDALKQARVLAGDGAEPESWAYRASGRFWILTFPDLSIRIENDGKACVVSGEMTPCS